MRAPEQTFLSKPWKLLQAQVQGLEESLTGLKSEVGGLRTENGDLSRHLSEEQAKTIR